MISQPPVQIRPGDYAMNFPRERDGDRQTAKDAMKRNGCKAIRFEKRGELLIAHGYIGRMSGPEVEDL